MNTTNTDNAMMLDGESRRPEDIQNATAEEDTDSPSNPVSDDSAEVKPTGPSVPDDHIDERRRHSLRYQTYNLATWNVQGANDLKIHCVEEEMRKNCLKIVGIAETWKLGQGKEQTEGGSTLILSGRVNGPRRAGVGFVVDKEAARSIMGYNPISDRILTLRLRAQPVNITIVQVYAPTADSNELDIEDFYESLQSALDNVANRDFLVLMGDWNAKIGKCSAKREAVGIFGLGKQNERGRLLEEFCAYNRLVIGNTMFQHHPRRLWTWRSPGGRVKNQIDFILVKKRWASSLLNTKTIPSADCGSDHQLLKAKFKLRLKRIKRPEHAAARIDVERVGETQFGIEIRRRFNDVLEDRIPDSPESLWGTMKKNVLEAARATIPKQRRKLQPWISQETMDLVEVRGEAKRTGDMTSWATLNKETNAALLADKRAFIEDKCMEIEANRGDSKRVFQIVREITNDRSTRSDAINDADGNTLTEGEDIKLRWAEYCKNLFTCKDSSPQPKLQVTTEDQEPVPLRSEVEQSLKNLKNGKAPGVDGIPAELWKLTGEEGISLFHELITKIWTQAKWPHDWSVSTFLTLPKKGNLKECANHRTISLISHASKILLKIIMNRIESRIESEIPEEQTGFRRNKGTREQIINVRNIIEKCRSHKTPVYLVFIDYSKAFDCVSHQALWETMQEMGFPTHITQLISSLYEQQEGRVKTNVGLTEPFPIGRGVRQGCVMSPKLFNIYAERIMRDVLEDLEGGIKFNGRRVTNLRYADDTTFICRSEKELLEILESVKTFSERKGLLLNAKKTKIMVIDQGFRGAKELKLAGVSIDVVDSFEYLGSVINTRGDSTPDINRRLGIARTVTMKLVKIWQCRGISLNLKLRLLRALAFSIASYGAESWAMTKTDQKKVDAFEMWCYRRMLRIPWTARRRNTWVLDKLGCELSLRKSILDRKLRFFGHAMRSNGLEKDIIQGMLENKRRVGRPPVSWLDDVKQSTGLSAVVASREALNRQKWNTLCRHIGLGQ